MPTLKALRTLAGLSQTELANASGVSLETIKKIETGKVERPHPATLRLLAAVLGQVPVVMSCSHGGPVFDPGMFDNARRNEMPCLHVLPERQPGVPFGFVPLRETRLSGTLVGPLANLTLTQLFAYHREECDRVLEARYRFPLPGDAAVQNVVVRFGEVVVETALAPHDVAERAYAEARQHGRQAALATRESADVLSLDLSGLLPDQEVVVQTSFVQAARPDGTGWELRVPLTIGPRYSRPDETGSPASHGQPLQVWRDPGHRFSLDLQIDRADASVVSSSHALAVTQHPDGAQWVRLADETIVPDRDVVLNWRLPQAAHPSLDVMVHEDLAEGTRYFLALITPPANAEALPALDREVIVLVDRSGSMSGAKWQACRWAVRRFLAGLSPSDSFNLGLFQNRTDWLFTSPLRGTDTHRAQALAFLDAHGPNGGTELGIAIEQALRSDLAAGERARHVLVVTDAQVSDEARILQLVEAEGARPGGRRVSVISIDSAPRSDFVLSLAEAGGGEAVFLSSDPHEEDITTALDRVLDSWARPLATGLELQVEAGAGAGRGGQKHAAGVTRSRIGLGNLPAGRSLWVSGAVSLFSEPVFRLRAGARPLAERTLDLDSAPESRPEIRALFGARQIARLERLEAQAHDEEARDAILDELGYANDPLRLVKTRPIYVENVHTEGSIVHRLLARESLRFGLVCSATAFVGERLEAGRRVTAQVHVPSALPAGWSGGVVAAGLPMGPALRMAPAAANGGHAPMLGRFRMGQDAGVPPMEAMRASGSIRLGLLRFHGTPEPRSGSVVLAEGVAGSDLGQQLRALRATLEPLGTPTDLDERLELWVCVDDPSAPVVRVKLRDLLTFGERPLNLDVVDGSRVMLIMHAPERRWPADAGVLLLELSAEYR